MNRQSDMSSAFGMTELGSMGAQNPGMMGPRPMLPPKPGTMDFTSMPSSKPNMEGGKPPMPAKPGMMGPRPLMPPKPNANPLSNMNQNEGGDPFATSLQERGFYQQLFMQLVL